MILIGTFVPKIKNLVQCAGSAGHCPADRVKNVLALCSMGRGGIIFWRAGGPQSEIQTIFSFIS